MASGATHTQTHNFPDDTAGSVYAISEKSSIFKKFTLSLQNTYTCILTILLHYHLAGNLILMNCQNVIKYVKIVMYTQFCMLTWFKILVILFIV